MFVAKLTDGGATSGFAWAQRAGGTGSEFPRVLAASGGSVYVAGYFASPTAGFGPVTLTSAGNADVFVAKLTDEGATGGFAWAQRAGGAGNEGANALALRGSSVYVAGGFASLTADFGPVTLANVNPSPNPNPYLGFLASLTDMTLPAATAAAGPRELGSIYPNPAQRTATLRLPDGGVPTPLTLTDALGRAARRYAAPAGAEAFLDLRGLPAGLYLLRGAGATQHLVVE